MNEEFRGIKLSGKKPGKTCMKGDSPFGDKGQKAHKQVIFKYCSRLLLNRKTVIWICCAVLP
jgi:hypothetical protein